jgi:hypothetical protein
MSWRGKHDALRGASVNAQLIDAETGSHIWRNGMIAPLRMCLPFRMKSPEALTRSTQLSRTQNCDAALRKPPENLGAWEAYQRGPLARSKATATDIERALDFFSISTKLDTTFASPHAMLAYFYG